MICQKDYTYIPNLNETLENLNLILNNRQKTKIIFISSKPLNLVAILD